MIALLKTAHKCFLLGLLALSIAAASVHAEDAEEPITIFAAASLSVVMPEMAKVWSEQTENPVPRFSFGPSGTMARQIGMQAPADIYISANRVWTDWLTKQNIGGNARTVAHNRLALITKGNTEASSGDVDLSKLLTGRRLIVADAATAPLGVYSQQALTAIGAPASVAQVPARDARTVLTLMKRGAGDYAFIYASDANRLAAEYRVITIGATLHDPITYRALAVSTDPQAVAFIDWLNSAEADAIWQVHGFR